MGQALRGEVTKGVSNSDWPKVVFLVRSGLLDGSEQAGSTEVGGDALWQGPRGHSVDKGLQSF